MVSNTETPVEMELVQDQVDRKLFETGNLINVKECLGTLFLGVLAILLLVALLHSLSRFEAAWKSTQHTGF